VPARRGNWEDLAQRTRERWLGAFGGTSRDRARREERAQAAYQSGARIGRAQAGHEPVAVRGGRAESAYVGRGAEFRVFEGLSRAEARRISRYNSIVGQLSEGRISEREFERKVSTWRQFRGERLTSDPGAVLAQLDIRRAGELELFEYRSGRST
jgi:hypothetical protein